MTVKGADMCVASSSVHNITPVTTGFALTARAVWGAVRRIGMIVSIVVVDAFVVVGGVRVVVR